MTIERPGNSIYLGLLLHNHQPVGNFPWVFQQVYTEAYLPMIEALERHPGVRLALHYTGSLLDWFTKAHPEFLLRIAALVQRKQIEIATGGYYEPILPAIPDADKIGQIQLLTTRIEQDFETKPAGMWLAERVWEPALPHLLREAGVEWVILDDTHFKNVGLEDHDLYGYYATEDQSSVLKVFATSKDLRYTIPWRPAAETIDTLRTLATRSGQRILVMGDDGEKFGAWPGMQQHCWGEDGRSGWVEQFFRALEENSSWLHTILLSEYAQSHSALGRIYLPTSSYLEMTEWALPAQKSFLFNKTLHQLEQEKRPDILQFMRGGFWRNFLVRYPEINVQHKKMLRVHTRVYAAGATAETGLIHLWKAQANDTYWHGLFGGIYMTHVRSAIYHHLIKAENAADRILYGTTAWQRYEMTDFDHDTQDELIIEGDRQNLYIDTQHGGRIFEWDMRQSAHNLSSVMTRRPESYHQTLREFEMQRRRNANRSHQENGTDAKTASPHTTIRTKEPNLDQYLIMDRDNRYSLADHFLSPGLPLKNFAQMRYEEMGDFVAQPYATQVEQDAHGITTVMTREGSVRRAGALSPLSVRLTKTLFVPIGEEKLTLFYQLENLGLAPLHTSFACEWNINLLGGGGNPQAYYNIEGHELEQQHFDSTGEELSICTFHVGNTWLHQDIGFSMSKPTTLWHFPIETVTGSEAGFERTHQGSCMLLLWPLILEAGETWQVEISAQGQLI